LRFNCSQNLTIDVVEQVVPEQQGESPVYTGFSHCFPCRHRIADCTEQPAPCKSYSMAKPTAAEHALRFFGLGLARLIYRVTATGLEHLPKGGFLLLPNHITWVDAIVLLLASPRPIRFVIDQGVYRTR